MLISRYATQDGDSMVSMPMNRTPSSGADGTTSSHCPSLVVSDRVASSRQTER